MALRNQITKDGRSSLNKLLKIFNACATRNDIGVSSMVDYWSARHGNLMAYGGVLACGISKEFEWFSFPLRIDEISPVQAKDSMFTYDFLTETIFITHIYVTI